MQCVPQQPQLLLGDPGGRSGQLGTSCASCLGNGAVRGSEIGHLHKLHEDQRGPASWADLAGHAGSINNSWDVLSVNGGADDGSYTFANALESYYVTAQLIANSRFGAPLPPWQATHTTTPGCPGTNSVYSTAKRLAVQHPLAAAGDLWTESGHCSYCAVDS